MNRLSVLLLAASCGGIQFAGEMDLSASPATASLRGVTRGPDGQPVGAAQVTIHGVADHSDRTVVSGADGAFQLASLMPGRYQLTAKAEGFTTPTATTVDLNGERTATVELPMANNAVTSTNVAQPSGFFRRLAKAYADDWRGSGDNGEPPKFRGYPMPESNPPYPFSVWPIGGTVWIGYPNATSYPLTNAIYGSKHGDWLKKENIQLYGWVDVGANLSTSHHGPYANAPAAYNQISDSVQLDQYTFYAERVPDTVQTDHFDWGFRLTNLYGFDYRFTTANGYFSQQLLNNPKADGTIGNKYGYDPVMAYVDLYFPKVGQGMDVRIGRYISLPDIEAQLAPNNYTYTHSLTYTYDCYTQTGINATIKWSDHWTTQAGISGGCEAAPWSNAAKLTGNFCVGYTWSLGLDNVYVCANSLNDSRYNYNNLAAYYATWYHHFGHSRWHMAWETWYQYMSRTPNVLNPAAASLLLTNSNGAVCKNPSELTCFAPEWATLHYLNYQISKKDFVSFRNEYFNDLKGQRTGFKTIYTEHMIAWNHWLGSTLVFRPELRFEHAYDVAAYDTGTKKSQLI